MGWDSGSTEFNLIQRLLEIRRNGVSVASLVRRSQKAQVRILLPPQTDVDLVLFRLLLFITR